MIVGIDVGSETHYARAFDWRNYEYSKKPLEFSNNEAGFVTFKVWMEELAEKYGKRCCDSWDGANRTLLVQSRSIPAGQRNETSSCESTSCKKNQKSWMIIIQTKMTVRIPKRLRHW